MAWHRLADKKHMSVRRAQKEIDAEEFANWLAYYEMETWDLPGYHQAGIICASVANMLGNKDIVAADFMPLEKGRGRGKGMEPAKAQKALAAMFGGE